MYCTCAVVFIHRYCTCAVVFIHRYCTCILTKYVTIHPWFGCVERPTLNSKNSLENLQFLIFSTDRVKTKQFFLDILSKITKSTCVSQSKSIFREIEHTTTFLHLKYQVFLKLKAWKIKQNFFHKVIFFLTNYGKKFLN